MDVETRYLRLLLCEILYDCYGASKMVSVVHFLRKPGEKLPELFPDAFFTAVKKCNLPEILIQETDEELGAPDLELEEIFENAEQWKFFDLQLARDGFAEHAIVEVRKGECHRSLRDLTLVRVPLDN